MTFATLAIGLTAVYLFIFQLYLFALGVALMSREQMLKLKMNYWPGIASFALANLTVGLITLA